MSYQNSFVLESRQLRSKGSQLNQLHQIYKALGLTTSAVSGLALFASGGAVVPLAMGAIAYAGALLSENQRTGKLKPLPWVSSDLTGIAAASLHQENQGALGTQAHHYLSPEDKALFYLTNFKGPQLTALAESMEPDQFDHILVNLVDHLVTAHEPALNHPELLGQALQTDFFESAVASLPTATSRAVGAHTKLAAVEVQALPVASAIAESPAVHTAGQNSATGPTPVHGVYLSQLLATKLKSTLLLGAPRSGKGYCMAHAVELLPDTVDLWAIDPKNDPSEDHYWARFPRNQIVRFDCTELDPVAVAEKCLSLFERFSRAQSTAQSPKLLVIDEAAPGLSSCNLTAAQAKEAGDSELAGWFKKLMLKCARLASVGPSKGKFVWVLSQSSTGDDLGISNGNKGGYRVCAVGHRDTAPTWYDSIASSLKIGKPSGDVLATGYIQNDGSGWYRSQPFELKATSGNFRQVGTGKADNVPPIVDMGSVFAEPENLDHLLKKEADHPIEKSSPWEIAKAKMQGNNSPLLHLIEWAEARDDSCWPLANLRDNQKLRNTLGRCDYFDGNSTRDKVESAVMILVHDGLLSFDGQNVSRSI